MLEAQIAATLFDPRFFDASQTLIQDSIVENPPPHDLSELEITSRLDSLSTIQYQELLSKSTNEASGRSCRFPPSLCPSATLRAQLMGVFSPLAERLNGNGQRERVKRPPFTQQVPPREALHEVGLPLVLLGLGGLPRAALACESHVPALVLGVLECCVVVLQDNLGEDAVFASSFPLRTKAVSGKNIRHVRGKLQICHDFCVR